MAKLSDPAARLTYLRSQWPATWRRNHENIYILRTQALKLRQTTKKCVSFDAWWFRFCARREKFAWIPQSRALESALILILSLINNTSNQHFIKHPYRLQQLSKKLGTFWNQIDRYFLSGLYLQCAKVLMAFNIHTGSWSEYEEQKLFKTMTSYQWFCAKCIGDKHFFFAITMFFWCPVNFFVAVFCKKEIFVFCFKFHWSLLRCV